MFGLWRSWTGRRAAGRAIRPLLDSTRARLGPIPETAWRDPYIVGLLTTLITLYAIRRTGALGEDDLASVQSGAWTDLTGCAGSDIGDEICFLSLAEDEQFIAGCRAAKELVENAARGEDDESAGWTNFPPSADPSQGMRSALWARSFEARLG